MGTWRVSMWAVHCSWWTCATSTLFGYAYPRKLIILRQVFLSGFQWWPHWWATLMCAGEWFAHLSLRIEWWRGRHGGHVVVVYYIVACSTELRRWRLRIVISGRVKLLKEERIKETVGNHHGPGRDSLHPTRYPLGVIGPWSNKLFLCIIWKDQNYNPDSRVQL